MQKNPLGLNGISFIEFSSPRPAELHHLFMQFGFSRIARHPSKDISMYKQNGIVFLLNNEPHSFAEKFNKSHGPSICSMGWCFENAKAAHKMAVQRGGRACEHGDYNLKDGSEVPAIYGIGDSLIYFVEPESSMGFLPLQDPDIALDKGFMLIDHLTNNVYKGTMNEWASFYKDIFGFQEVRYFDIKGQKTGLTSYALRSPCGQFCIPINEADEAKSQINEYLNEYKGPGVQHLAFLTKDLITSIQKLHGSGIEMLDISPSYYEKVFQRVPHVKEEKNLIQDLNILVDGDEDGYLLQIFTKTLIGPIFIELIQRNNHLSFGEGNFQALFDSIERDQMKRGVL